MNSCCFSTNFELSISKSWWGQTDFISQLWISSKFPVSVQNITSNCLLPCLKKNHNSNSVVDKIVDRKIYNDCNEDINEFEYYACVRNAIRKNLTSWTIPKYVELPGYPKYGVTCTVPFYSSILPVRYTYLHTQ